MNPSLRNTLRLGLLAAAVVLAGCGEPHEQAGQTEGHSETSPGDTTAARPGGPDSTGTSGASAVALEPIDSRGIKALAADGHANATLVSVWATWCEPCRTEFPDLLAAVEAHRAEGLRLVLVSTDFDEQLPEVRRFLAQHGVREKAYVKHEADMAFIDSLSAGWSGTIPATFMYDARGRLVGFWQGRADRAKFEAAIKQALVPAQINIPKGTHS